MRRTSSVGVSALTDMFVWCSPHVSMCLCMHALVNAQRHVAMCCLCVMFHVSSFSSRTQAEMESLSRFKWVNFIIHTADFQFSMCRVPRLLWLSKAEVLPFQCMHQMKNTWGGTAVLFRLRIQATSGNGCPQSWHCSANLVFLQVAAHITHHAPAVVLSWMIVVQLEQFMAGYGVRSPQSHFTLITGQTGRMPGPSHRPANHSTVPRYCIIQPDALKHLPTAGWWLRTCSVNDEGCNGDISLRIHWQGWLYCLIIWKSIFIQRSGWKCQHITVICRQMVTLILPSLVFPGFTLLHLIATGVSCFLGAGLLSFLVYVYCQRFHKPSQESAVIHPTTPNHLNYKGNTTPKNEKYTPMEFKVSVDTIFRRK